MKFKNELEEQAFLIAQKVYGDTATIDHNKVIQIENAIFPEVFSFSGPPKKEIDVITAELNKEPKISLLISCKDFNGKKAEPAHVQEWASVLHTMSKYAKETIFLGLVLCPNGFTGGCEPWVTSANIATIPPIKGNYISYPLSTSLQMFERTLIALKKRILLPFNELLEPPEFYDFVYRITADFEGFENALSSSVSKGRYFLADSNWKSSFGELVTKLIGKKIIDILSTSEYIGLLLEENYVFKVYENKIIWGETKQEISKFWVTPICKKNLSLQDCSFDFVKDLLVGQKLTSAADFQTYFEFGLENQINLGFHKDNTLFVICTKNPVDKNEL